MKDPKQRWMADSGGSSDHTNNSKDVCACEVLHSNKGFIGNWIIEHTCNIIAENASIFYTNPWGFVGSQHQRKHINLAKKRFEAG